MRVLRHAARSEQIRDEPLRKEAGYYTQYLISKGPILHLDSTLPFYMHDLRISVVVAANKFKLGHFLPVIIEIS